MNPFSPSKTNLSPVIGQVRAHSVDDWRSKLKLLLRFQSIVRVILVVSIFLIGFCDPAKGQLNNDGTEPLSRIRRIYVPEDDIGDFIKRLRGYIRMDRDEFEKRIEKIENAEPDLEVGPTISKAVVNVTVQPNRLISGTTTATFRSKDPDRSRVLKFEQLRLMLQNVRIEGEQDTFLKVMSDQSGTVHLPIGTSPSARFDWENQTQFRPQRSSKLTLGLLPATSTEILMRIPMRWTPQSSNLMVEKSDEEPEGEFQLWKIRAEGDAEELVIDLVDSEEKKEAVDTLFHSQQISTRIEEDKILLKAVVEFDSIPDRLTFSHPGFICEQVKFQDRLLPFEMLRKTNNEKMQSRVQLGQLIDKELKQSRFSITITGFIDHLVGQSISIQPLRFEESERLSCRGNIEIIPGIEWARIEAVGLQLMGNRQLSFLPASFASSEHYRFTAYDEKAELKFSCKRSQSTFGIESVCNNRISTTQITGKQFVAIEKDSSGKFALSFSLSPLWIVDNVSAVEDEGESSPIRFWETRSSAVGQSLFVQFSDMIGDRPRLLQIDAHRPSLFGSSLELKQLNIATLIDAPESARYYVQWSENSDVNVKVNYGTSLPLQRKLRSESLLSISSANQDEFRFNIFDDHTVLFETENVVEFDLSSTVTVTASRQAIQEEFNIQLTPLSGLRKVQIEVNGQNPVSQWRLAGVENTRLSAKEVRSAGGIQNWEFEFSPALREPANLVAVARKAVENAGSLIAPANFSVSLVDCSDANSMQQKSIIGTSDGVGLSVDANDADQVPISKFEQRGFLSSYGAFRRIGDDHRISLTWKSDTLAKQDCIAANADVLYRFERDQIAVESKFQLLNAAGANFSFRIPTDSQLIEVRINERRVFVADSGSKVYEVELPSRPQARDRKSVV